MIKKILKAIKKYNTIIIARHIGADPDALGSSIGLKQIILANYPHKKVYVVGSSASKFKYFGNMDKLPEEIGEALLIITDTPDKKRVDGIHPDDFPNKIKIDHHPFIEEFCNIEWIDDTASSVSQMIIEFALKSRLKIPKEAAANLFMGVVGDTGRFFYDYTTAKTFELVAKLIKKTNLNFTSLYSQMYLRTLNDIKFSSYIINHLTITENKLGYIKLDSETLKNNNVDASTAGNLINDLNIIDEVLVMVFCSEDTMNNYIKCTIRSRGPIINETASHYNGGGHVLASGARPKTFEDVDCMIQELDEVCKNYLEKK